jgi:hypothetical protein
VPLPSDSWDFDPDEDLPNDPYRGVRRAGAARRRLPLIIGGAVGIVTAIVIAWIATAGGTETGLPEFQTNETSVANDPSSDVGGSDAAVPSISVHTMAGAPSSTVKPFTTLVYEAETGMPQVKLRGAQVVTEAGASGGKAVRITSSGGEIQLRGITVPSAGTYRLTVYYAPGEVDRTGHIGVGNAAELSLSFAGGAGCCSSAAADATLAPGSYSATITMSTVDPAGPAIDRVVISRP